MKAKDAEVKAKDAEVKAKDAEMKAKEAEMKAEMETKEAEMKAKMEAKEAQIMKLKDDTIYRLIEAYRDIKYTEQAIQELLLQHYQLSPLQASAYLRHAQHSHL